MELPAACQLARTALQKCWQNACLCMHFINNWCESTKLTQQTEVFKKTQPSPGTLAAHELHQRNIGRRKADWIQTTMLQRISPGFCVHGKTHGDEKLLPPLVQLTFNRGSACSKNQPATAWPASWYATVFFSSGCSTCVFFSRPARDEKRTAEFESAHEMTNSLSPAIPKALRFVGSVSNNPLLCVFVSWDVRPPELLNTPLCVRKGHPNLPVV